MLVLVVAGYAIYHSFRNVTSAPPPPGCQAGTGVQAIDARPRAGGGRGHHRGRRGQAPAAAAGGHHRPGRRAAGIEAAQPGLRRPRLGRDLPAAPVGRLGLAQPAPGPGLRHDQVLRRPHPGARLRQDAGLPGGSGRAAQRGRFGLPAVDRRGRAAGRLLHREVTARRVLLVHPVRPGEPGGGGAADRADVRASGAESRRGAGSPRTVRAKRTPRAPRSCTSGGPRPGRWPAGWSRTPRPTTSAKYGMPVSPGKPRMAVWAGSASPTRHRRQGRTVSSLAEAASSGDPPYCVSSRTTTGVHP